MPDIVIHAEDDYPLAATLWDGGADDCIVIAPGVGIRRHFYRHLAEFLAGEGLTAITYDHRGIGESLQGPVRKAEASMTRWSKLDTNGVVRWARDRTSGSLYLLGHSGGGQMLGMLESAAEIDASVFVTAQSGYWRHWPFPQNLALGFLWHVVVPALVPLFGYFPAKTFGLGEDLPSGVAREWAKWGRSRGYLFDHVSREDLVRYETFDRPILAWSFGDDSYAPLEAVQALLARYPSAEIDHRHVSPADVTLSKIAHFGFFRPESRDSLWEETMRWLEAGITPSSH